jgi:hypothetical protein
MDEKAKVLAQALLDAGRTSYIETYTVEGTDDRIVVIVQRVDAKRERALREVTKAVAGPWGEPCPCCSGTGRI